jgi:hypothetical protein
MNAFYEHHKDSIHFSYRGFDRILLNASIQPFLQGKRTLGFFWTYRHLYPVSRDVLHDISNQYHNWVMHRSLQWELKIQKAPKEERRDEFVDKYFRQAQPNQLVAILKAREPAHIMISVGKNSKAQGHLDIAWRWVDQYSFYINDEQWGRMFVRVCPYFPFSARVCLNQHYWLANRMKAQGIRFQQCKNAFLRCSDPEALQQLADSLTAKDVIACGQKWLAYLTPFFTDKERKQAGCQHRIFFAQVEYCDNLIFKQRAAVDRLEERLLDANRTIGQPNKLTIIFGRRITKRHPGKLQTVIEDLNLPNPVIRSHYNKGFLKQYVRDDRILRTEPATNNIFADYKIPKAVENLPQLRDTLGSIIDNYLDVQQDILETFVDRGQFQRLSEPTVWPNGKRVPGLKPNHPRQLALMQALVRFANIAAGSTFSTAEIHPHAAAALRCSTEGWKLGSLRYELSKLRAKGLVEKLPHARRYRLSREGYQVCLVYLKLAQKVYAPLATGILDRYEEDAKLDPAKLTKLDQAYSAVLTALDNLVQEIGLKAA